MKFLVSFMMIVSIATSSAFAGRYDYTKILPSERPGRLTDDNGKTLLISLLPSHEILIAYEDGTPRMKLSEEKFAVMSDIADTHPPHRKRARNTIALCTAALLGASVDYLGFGGVGPVIGGAVGGFLLGEVGAGIYNARTFSDADVISLVAQTAHNNTVQIYTSMPIEDLLERLSELVDKYYAMPSTARN